MQGERAWLLGGELQVVGVLWLATMFLGMSATAFSCGSFVAVTHGGGPSHDHAAPVLFCKISCHQHLTSSSVGQVPSFSFFLPDHSTPLGWQVASLMTGLPGTPISSRGPPPSI